jgi:RND family efflux transporter MFP subunit
MSDEERAAKSRRSRGVYGVGISILVAAVVLLAVLLLRQTLELRGEARIRTASVEAGPHVRVAEAVRGPEIRTVTYVGEARPYAEATLYSKVSGYLSIINVDKGDKVILNQLLAVIESPELDRQYDAAVADAISKRLIAQRNNDLLKSGSVSPQTAEQTEAAAKTAEELAASLLAQKNYELMRAPFAGTVTARYADPGALIQSATTGSGTALPVVTLSQTDTLRVYVYPDQKTASFVQMGDHADISDAARPDVKLSGSVTRTSGELDTKTRTLLVEIDIDNTEGKIIPGSFVQVSLEVRTLPYVEIPADALVMRQDKAFAAVVGSDDKVRFQPITIYETDAKTVKVSQGLGEGDQVALNLGDSVAEGQKVQAIREGKKGEDKGQRKGKDK